MTSSAKIWISWIIIALVVLGSLYWYFSRPKAQAPVDTGNQAQATTTAPSTAPAGSLLTAKDDSTDAALDQDSSSLDANMTALSSDYSNIDSSLSDKAVAQ